MTESFSKVTSIRKWTERSNTVGMLPGGTTFQVACLEQILRQLPVSRERSLALTTGMGEAIEIPADEVCRRQLSPMGLAVRDREVWRPTEFSMRWLENTSDSASLAVHIHANCKFVGELIQEIGDDTTHEDLLRVARGKYSLSWEKLDPVRRRVAWLRSLGLVEMWGRRLVVTDSGKELLAYLPLASSDEALGQNSSSEAGDGAPIAGVSSVVQERLVVVNQDSLTKRRDPIGYIPRGAKRAGDGSAAGRLTALEGLRKAVGLIDVGATVEEFRSYAQQDLAVVAGSFTAMMHTLRHLEFIELIAYNKYGPTELAYACLEVGREADLVRFLHSKFSFIGELLNAAGELVSTTQLLTTARSAYGFGGDASEMRTRIALLADAGFLERFDKSRARITPRGEELLGELPLQGRSSVHSRLSDMEGETHELVQEEGFQSPIVDSVLSRLATFGSAGTRDKEFEATVREAFELLGFQAQHIGGSSDTDVLLTAELPAQYRYTAILEAKSTSQGSVPEGQINFEAVKRHRKARKADCAAIVGIKFAKSVGESATANNIALITVEDLVSLIQEHARTPLSLGQLRQAFDPAKSNLAGLESMSEELRNDLALTAALVSTLCAEAAEDDPEDRGFASVGNLRFALRSADLTFRPSREQIVSRLKFLAHPTIGAVQEVEVAKGESVYAVADSPRNIALRLRALADQIEKFANVDEDQ